MWMTDGEIAMSYSHAENQNRQIAILAELNECDAISVIQALNRQGIRLTARRPPRARVVKGTGRPWMCDDEIKKRIAEYNAALNVLLSMYTQAELSRICGVRRWMINSYVLHHKAPSTETFEKMLKGLGLTREQFFHMGGERRDGAD